MFCQKTGKQIHLSINKAQKHLIRLKEMKNYEGKVYGCLYCGGWHIGRQKKNARKNKYKGNLC
jgi:hypothetical protein